MKDKDDEIIAEVRRARAQILKECGGTLEGVFARMIELQKKHADRLVSFPPRRLRPSKRR